MDKLLETLAVQVPAAAILAVVVIAFMKHLGHRDRATVERDRIVAEVLAKRDVIIQELSRDNVQAREQSRLIIEKNTVAATQNTEAMHQMTNIMKEFLKRNKS